MKENQGTNIGIKELPKKFKGKGEVKGYSFTQIDNQDGVYIYRVEDDESNNDHYEVFNRKLMHPHPRMNPQPEWDKYVQYPASGAFGISAWTCRTYEDALVRYYPMREKRRKKALS